METGTTTIDMQGMANGLIFALSILRWYGCSLQTVCYRTPTRSMVMQENIKPPKEPVETIKSNITLATDANKAFVNAERGELLRVI